MSKRNLYLITDSFPYGIGEKTFIVPELFYLQKEFNVTIVSCATDSLIDDESVKTELNPSIFVANCNTGKVSFLKKIGLAFKTFATKEFWGELKQIFVLGENRYVRVKKAFWFFYDALFFADWMEKKKFVKQNNDVIYYSYWYNARTLGCVLLKKKYPGMKIVTRAHGYDLYDERMDGDRQPFKEIMDPALDMISFIAETGRKYYLDRYHKKNDKKYQLFRLGAPKAIMAQKDIKGCVSRKEQFCLVSCSNMVSLKRIHLIIETLALVDDIIIRWTHFGDGPEREHLESLVRDRLSGKTNITVNFMGWTTREAIYQYYAENQVHCFITTSESEGLPVSIMEAMAYGIPIIATNVGGIHELIKGNGYLLSANPTPDEVRMAVYNMQQLSQEEYMEMRKQSKTIWADGCDAEKNAREFVKEINQL